MNTGVKNMNRKIFEEYYNVNFSVDKSIASKLPKWAVERMIDLDKIGNYSYMMKPFEEDENQEYVQGYADSLNELKWQLAQYKKDHSRYGIDY